MTDIKQYEPLWGSWYVDRLIGEGSFGKVYRVKREEFGKTYYSAVKLISIPQNDADYRQMKSEGLDDASARSYFQVFVADIIQEIDLMSEFRGNSNIVSFEDHKVIESQNGAHWDILIRMELLTSLTEHANDKPLSTDDVIKLGIHICRALELCAVKKTIHRDIKPDNIFISQYGDYKLGDFGIARQIERTMSGLSKKGTYTYMAPEVLKGDDYGASVDTYSLGIVLYRFLNGGRTPFLPDFPNPILPRDRDESLQRRMRGEALPPITGVAPELNDVVLRACSFDRSARFATATEMREALEQLSTDGKHFAPVATPIYTDDERLDSTVGLFANNDYTEGSTSVTEGVFSSAPQTEATSVTEGVWDNSVKSEKAVTAPVNVKDKKSKKPLVAALAALLALFIGLGSIVISTTSEIMRLSDRVSFGLILQGHSESMGNSLSSAYVGFKYAVDNFDMDSLMISRAHLDELVNWRRQISDEWQLQGDYVFDTERLLRFADFGQQLNILGDTLLPSAMNMFLQAASVEDFDNDLNTTCRIVFNVCYEELTSFYYYEQELADEGMVMLDSERLQLFVMFIALAVIALSIIAVSFISLRDKLIKLPRKILFGVGAIVLLFAVFEVFVSANNRFDATEEDIGNIMAEVKGQMPPLSGEVIEGYNNSVSEPTAIFGQEPDILYIHIPNLIGLPFEDAQAQIDELNLTLGNVSLEVGEMPYGTVIKQNPLPNTEVQEYAKISIVISDESLIVLPQDVTNSYVQDNAGVITSQTTDKINEISGKIAAASGGAIVVITDEHLPAGWDYADEYANYLFDKIGIGSAELNNGLLLYFTTKENRVWLATGKGMDGTFDADAYLESYFYDGYDRGDYDTATLKLVTELSRLYS